MRLGLVLALCIVLLGSASTAAAKKYPTLATISAAYVVTADYQNSQILASCNAPLAEHISLNARTRFAPIPIKRDISELAHNYRPTTFGSFSLTGQAWSSYGCSNPPVPINCTGPIGDEGNLENESSLTLRPHRGRVDFGIFGNWDALSEVEQSGTCPNSDAFRTKPVGEYLGANDLTRPWGGDIHAVVSLRRLLRLKPHHVLWLKITPMDPDVPDLASCAHLGLAPDVRSCSATLSNLRGGLAVARGRIDVSKGTPPPLRPLPTNL
jgi:hypothetical protein